ncbi:hypothetical protein [Aegicerativicinus sediminis]|uniref:hypothetical protein n=1 Tax=Aegicerativicinus sediminis TaxID=2893202 RepID=UPI001E4B3E22|nr:hypothetical protein [Aegicerativicinus sediminis]
MKKPDFLKRLQQGNVLRSAVSYMAVSWLILQACSLLFPLFGISDSYIRLILVGLIILFPIWLLLTYLYDFSLEGITKTDQSILDEETILKSKSRLNRTIITVLSLAIIILVLDRIFIFSGESGSDLRSIAVIPFSNISGNDAQTYFVDGMQDELIGTLAMVKDLRVTSKTSTNQYKKTTKSVQEIAKELSVDAIIEGSVLLFQNSLRIQIKLIQAFPIEKTILTQQYDKPLKDVLQIHREVTKDVVDKVKVALTDQTQKTLDEKPVVDPYAYELFLRGQSKLSEFTPISIQQSLNYFNKAKEVDSTFFGGYQGVSSAYMFMMVLGMVKPLEVRDIILENSAKARDLDSKDIGIQAGVDVWVNYDWENGEKKFKEGLKHNPSNSFGNIYYSHLLACLGRFEEANYYADKATEVDPLNPFVFGLKSVVKRANKEWWATDSIAQISIDMDPGNPFAYFPKSTASLKLGNEAQAFKEYMTYLKLTNQDYLGSKMDSIAQIEGFKKAYNYGGMYFEKIREDHFVPPHLIYYIYNKAGNTEKVLEWLQIAYKEHGHDMAYLGVAPFSPEIKNDSIYKDLIKKLKLPYVN